MRYISNHHSAKNFINNRREFNGSSMSGRKSPNGSIGRLPGAWRDIYYQTVNEIDYIVYSFATPIAWHLTNGLWLVPSATYSGYSSRHQHYARMAARGESHFTVIIDADIYYHSSEIAKAIECYRKTGFAQIMHNNRNYAYVTIRGIKSGDYVYNDEIGRWITVYGKESRYGTFNRRYWVAIGSVAGARVITYLGETGERIRRLR